MSVANAPPAPTPLPIEAVVVRTTRLAPSPADAAFAVTHIDAESLKDNVRLDEVITRLPGASLFRRTSSGGANPTTQGLSLRAMAPSGAGRALVTLDGAPQNDPFGGWVIWTALPPESIGAAAIVRGAGAGPYGAGALTGVVSLDSVQGDVRRADLSAGGLGYRRGAVVVAESIGGADAMITASAEHDDGWIPVRGGRAADTPLGLNAGEASARLQGDIGSATAAARVGLYQETRGAGLAGAHSRARGVNASLTVARPDGLAGWRLQGWLSASDLRNTSVAVAADRGATIPANDQYRTPAFGYGLNLARRGGGPDALWEIGGDLRVARGEDHERFRYLGRGFTRDRVTGGDALTAGLYAEAERRDGPWLMTGGARIDHWSTYDSHRTERNLASGAVTLQDRSPDRGGWVPTARAGVRRDWDDFAIRGAAYAGFRAPTLNELHRPFRVGNDITESNPALRPEKLYGAETAVSGAGDDPAWGVTLFYNVLVDPVTNVTIGAGPGIFPIAGFVPAGGALRQRRNAGRIDAVGVEAQAHGALTPRVSAMISAAYTDARVDGGASAPQLTGLRPAQAPRFAAEASLAFRVTDRLELSAAVSHEGARFEDDLNSRRLAASTTIDGRASWTIAPGAQVYLAADNLLDSDTATGQTADGVTSYGPPRLVRIGLSMRQ